MESTSRTILILHSSQDQKWLGPITLPIRTLDREYNFTVQAWDEKQLVEKEKEISQGDSLIDQAIIIVLLLSKSFLKTDFLKKEKIEEKLRDRKKNLLLLLLEKCDWEKNFRWLKHFPIWPRKGSFLSDKDKNGLNRVLTIFTEFLVDIFVHAQIPSSSKGGLTQLLLEGVGPVRKLSFQPQSRLNLITGDNGLGKSFLLECIWWTITGEWAEESAFPGKNFGRGEVKISFESLEREKVSPKAKSVFYNFDKQNWPELEEEEKSTNLAIYARVDGSFAIWDSIKRRVNPPQKGLPYLTPLVFEKTNVWRGIQDETNRWLCNGLFRDWIEWQSNAPNSPFEKLERILELLSPSHREKMKPGKPARLPGDTSSLPTLEYPYGDVPLSHAAISVKRFVSLAYLILWVWEEHRIACEEAKVDPQKKILILIDEVEAHLHPQWTRSIIPALLQITSFLDSELKGQFFISSHSPLITASLEPYFREDQDQLFFLDLEQNPQKSPQVILEETDFTHHGEVDSWLTSNIMNLKHARSLEAEKAIEDAEALQGSDSPNDEKILEVHYRLQRYLGVLDPFWPRWLYFAETHGAYV